MSKVNLKKQDPNSFKPITLEIRVVIETQEELDCMKEELKDGLYAENFSDFSSVFGDIISKIAEAI